MKKYLLFFLTLVFSLQLTAQENKLQLKSGIMYLSNDLQLNTSNSLNYCFMSFSAIPTNKTKNNIERIGIQFLEYIPNKTYIVSIPILSKNSASAQQLIIS